MFSVLRRLELFGVSSISILVPLHGTESDFSTKDAAYDSIVCHLVSGACDSEGSELCLSVHSAPHASLDCSRPVDLQSHILGGVLQTAKQKVFPRTASYMCSTFHAP